MNETTTESLLWKMDCKDFVKLKAQFKVHRVIHPDDVAFCRALIEQHGLKLQREGTTILLFPATDGLLSKLASQRAQESQHPS